jgi:hypothetical protein
VMDRMTEGWSSADQEQQDREADYTQTVETIDGPRTVTAHLELREDGWWVVPDEPVVLTNGDTLTFTLGRVILSE